MDIFFLKSHHRGRVDQLSLKDDERVFFIAELDTELLLDFPLAIFLLHGLDRKKDLRKKEIYLCLYFLS